MPRPARILLNTATTLSLLLALLTITLWIRSNRTTSQITLASRIEKQPAPGYSPPFKTIEHCLLVAPGQVGYARTECYGDFDGEGVIDFNDLVELARRYQNPNWAEEKIVHVLGFEIHISLTSTTAPTRVLHRLMIPFWFLTALFAALPLKRAWARLKNPPRGPTACQACGYDCRATPDRCPECGTTRAHV
jgi:hypothetical protein